MFFHKKDKIKKTHTNTEVNGKIKQEKKMQQIMLKCPRCNIEMRKLKKNNVVIDVCRKCNGLWLDDKEINKLLMGEKNDKK